MAKRDLIAGLILLIFGLVVAGLSLTYSYAEDYTPGPGFFPFWLALILVAFSIFLMFNSAKDIRSGANSKVSNKHKMFTNPKALFSSLAILLLVSFLLERVGFVIIVSITVTLFVKLVKPDYQWIKSILVGIVSTVIIYFCFRYGLGIMLPKGVLPL